MAFFGNSTLVVALGLILFIALLFYLKVPGKITGMLDARAERIRKELEDARRLREEAQTLLASYERKQKEVEEQASQIVAAAKAEAERAAEQAQEEIKASVARRVRTAEEQIASAEAAAVKEVRDEAIAVAVKAAERAIAAGMSAKAGDALIDDAIKEVGAKLH
ncbi:MAG: ATP F0F1 synthase subunit B [Pseudomonadota bacterium]